MKSSKLDRAVQLEQRSAIRKKNIGEYFVNFSRHHREWLMELAERYKARGEFPMIPMVILPSYYASPRDKEIAAFAALFLGEDADYSQIQAFHDMLGAHPSSWFLDREFVSLSVGRMQDKLTGGVRNWKIAKMFDKLWNECLRESYTTKDGDMVTALDRLSVTIENLSIAHHCSYYDVLTYLLEDCGVGNFAYHLRLLLMVLGTHGGFGLSLWSSHNLGETLQCPRAGGMCQFVHTWFPDYKRIGSADDAIRLFGFEGDFDFFYAYLAYQELQRRKPDECSLYATRYQTWYALGSRMKACRWRAIQPEIVF